MIVCGCVGVGVCVVAGVSVAVLFALASWCSWCNLMPKSRLKANDEKTLKEIRTLRRDITSYEMKIANLTAEIDELVAQKEGNTREYDQSMRLKDRINQELAVFLTWAFWGHF